jgi:hypothetical protein
MIVVETLVERSELQLRATLRWQTSGELIRTAAILRVLGAKHPMLATLLNIVSKKLLSRVDEVDAEYVAWRDQYLESHPMEARKYYRQKRPNHNDRVGRSLVDNNNRAEWI